MCIKKWISLAIALVMLTGMFAAAPIATAEEEYQSAISGPLLYAAPGDEEWSEGIDLDAFRSYLFEKLANCESSISIESYNLSMSAIRNVLEFIQLEIPEAFHVDFNNLRYTYNRNEKIVDLRVAYLFDKAEFQAKYAEVQAVAKKMVKGIKYLGEVEKALLLHDRIILHCAYEEEEFLPMDFTLYGALIERTAVCQGYSLAYKYLLKMVGMESYICSSQLLNHAWNIVTVNGTKYHVDVTWDDPVSDRAGRVKHNNFLRSTQGIISTKHHVNGFYDFDATPVDTTYDNYFWQKSDAAFQQVGEEIYYIVKKASTINRYSDQSVLLNIEDYWWAGPGAYYPGCYSHLSSDGYNLIYSLTNKVYKLNPETMENEVLFAPSSAEGTYLNIYSFILEGSTLKCVLSTSPNYDKTDLIVNETEEYELPTAPPMQVAVTIMQSLIGMRVETDDETMDLNADGRLSIADAVYLLRGLVA